MSISRKTKPRIWQPTFLVNRAINQDVRAAISHLFGKDKTPKVLDVGCGTMPYRQLFDKQCDQYVGCDFYPQSDGVVKCSADDLAFSDESFDAIVSFQVLEHVRRPWKVVSECARVLKKKGVLLLTAPFVFPHHSSPNDFFRYTHEGLASLAEDAGLAVEKISAQCSSFPTLLVMLNWYLMRFSNWFRRSRLTTPLAWLLTWGLTVPMNLVGVIFDLKAFRRGFKKGNEGYSNYIMICRKA